MLPDRASRERSIAVGAQVVRHSPNGTLIAADVTNDAVELTYTVANDRSDHVELAFPGGKVADVAVHRDDVEVWRWRDDRPFTQAIATDTLRPGRRSSGRSRGTIRPAGNTPPSRPSTRTSWPKRGRRSRCDVRLSNESPDGCRAATIDPSSLPTRTDRSPPGGWVAIAPADDSNRGSCTDGEPRPRSSREHLPTSCQVPLQRRGRHRGRMQNTTSRGLPPCPGTDHGDPTGTPLGCRFAFGPCPGPHRRYKRPSIDVCASGEPFVPRHLTRRHRHSRDASGMHR